MSARTFCTRCVSLLILCCSAVWSIQAAHSQSLDACEIDLDIKDEDLDECEIRSAGWLRLGFPTEGSGLLQSGSLNGQVTLTPGSANEVRVAQIRPTQATVWLSMEDTRATLIPGEWINVMLVRQSSANTYVVSVVHWQEVGLSVTGTVLATSTSFTQTGAMGLTVGWSYGQSGVTVNVSGPGSTTLAATRSGFGSTLPWLSLPHFPDGHTDLGPATVLSLTGSAQ